MPTEHTFRIDFHITQQGLDLGGTQEIVDSSQMQVDITQQGMHITATQDIYPTIEDYITFGKWYKGDKGDKGDPGSAEYGTTEYWNSRTGYIPQEGAIIVYSDYHSDVVDGQTVYYPGIKIGTGNGYVQDLVFCNEDDSNKLLAHLQDNTRHITALERTFWDNKLNVDDNEEIIGETLIFNRN